MEQLYMRRRVAYADAHIRIDAGAPVDEVVEPAAEASAGDFRDIETL